MGLYTFNSLTEWKELPLRKVNFLGADIDANAYIFDKILKEGSTLSIKPILSKSSDNSGGKRTVAYQIRALIQIIPNNLGDMKQFIIDSQVPGYFNSIQFTLEPVVQSTESQIMYITWLAGTEGYATIGDYILNCTIELVEGGPELQIEFMGILSVDAFNSTNFSTYINQGWT
jgi:hypothetical protein